MITGQCHCGASTFSTESDPGFMFLCYCKDCQVLNGGGHLAGFSVPKDSLKAEGPLQTYTYKGGSGKPVHAHFCSKCGTGLFGEPENFEGATMVKATVINQPERFFPKKKLYTESALHWTRPQE